jgi:hypothetical protein
VHHVPCDLSLTCAGALGALLSGGGPGGGQGGGGGMGGLLQMAMQVANDPAMQPMINNAMSSLMGAAGGGPGGGGPAGEALWWRCHTQRASSALDCIGSSSGSSELEHLV